MPRKKEKTTNANVKNKPQATESEKQNVKKQRKTQEEKQITKNGNSRRKDKIAVKSDIGRKDNGIEKKVRKKREFNKIEKYKFSGKKQHSKEVVEIIRKTSNNKQDIGKVDETLCRKRKSSEVQKLETSDKIPVVDSEGLDCVDGDLCLENFEVSKKLKLNPWPVRGSKEMTRGKRNIKSENNNETRIQKMTGNTVKKAEKRILGLKPKSKSSETEEFDFDLNVLHECKKKKCTSQKNDKNEFVGSKQKKTCKVSANNKTQGKKQPRSTKRKQDKVETQSMVDGKDIEIMSDCRLVEGGKEKKPKVDLPIIPITKALKKPVKTDIKPSVDMRDVTSVLLMMEGKSKVMDDAQPSTSGTHDDDEVKDFITGSSGEEESDWEDVEALPGHGSPMKSQIPSGPIEITLDGPQIMKKRKKKTFDVKAYFQRQLNRYQKELREHIHKVHFMCLLSRGMYLNRLCGKPVLQAQALSVIPPQFTSVSKKAFNINLLGRIIDWYRSSFPIQVTRDMMELTLANRLEESFKVSAVLSYLERALVLVVLLRSLGLMTRLVMSLQPVSFKESVAKKGVKGGSKLSKSSSKSKSSKNSHPNSKGEIATKNESSKKDNGKRLSENKNNDNVIESKYFKAKNKRLRSRGSKGKASSYKEIDSDDDESIQTSESENENRKLKKGKEKTTSNKNGKGKTKKMEDSQSSSDDDDFEEESFTVRSPINLLRRPGIKCKNRKIVSSDSDENEPKGCDTWAEVYIEAEEKWICIDCMKCQYIGKPNVIESQASNPVHYVFSFDNNGYVKDITPRYASKWLTETRKLRVSDDWLEETVNPYRSCDTDSHAKEDDDIKASLVSKPLPSSVGEFKNHPFYALKRHLLKFEAIYPNTAIPVGYLKNNEPIYARECVHTLHSRENWLKEGRAVRIKEEAYKMVKSRPRWNRKKENPDELDLEIFGHWQTEVYIPPPAVNGKVPRNGYGNIELFMPSMLPAGTVHLQLPGLNKVAKKLDIDCVAAMTGWDSHCGYSHPVLDGFVVCEEFKDILLAAWDEDQEIQKRREIEKREKRVIQNWQLLTKGLLIKEKLKRKYLLEPHLQEEDKVKTETKPGEKSDDFKKAWPMNKKGSESLSTAKHFKTETL